MARVANKLSPGQVDRLIRSTKTQPDDARVDVACVVADESEPVIQTTLGEVRAEVDGWSEHVCQVIQEHAEGSGRGTWRYVVRVVVADRIVASTWCRVVVSRADAEDDTGLDGSVSSYIQQMQRSLDQQQKVNVELQGLLMKQLVAQADLMRGLMERQAQLESDRAALLTAQLEAAKQAAEEEEDPMHAVMALAGPAVVSRLLDKHGDKLMQLLGVGDDGPLPPGEQ